MATQTSASKIPQFGVGDPPSLHVEVPPREEGKKEGVGGLGNHGAFVFVPRACMCARMWNRIEQRPVVGW